MLEVQIPMMASPGSARRHIFEVEQAMRARRSQITLWKHPLQTLTLFTAATLDFIVQACLYASRHPIMVYCLAPAMLLWIVLEYLPGPYTEAINTIEFGVQVGCAHEHFWWIGPFDSVFSLCSGGWV